MCSARVFRSRESAKTENEEFCADEKLLWTTKRLLSWFARFSFNQIDFHLARLCATTFTSPPSHTAQNLTHTPMFHCRHPHWMLFYCHVRNRKIQRGFLGIKNRIYVYRNQTKIVPLWVWKKSRRSEMFIKVPFHPYCMPSDLRSESYRWR